MQKLVIGMANSRGFTLIELLIVLVIIGITLSFTVIAFGDFGASKRTKFAAEQLSQAIKLTQQCAILENNTFGIRIDKDHYQIMKLYPHKGWAPLPHGSISKIMYFPKNTLVKLTSSYKAPHASPNIVINASGDITPFTIEFALKNSTSLVSLKSDASGALRFIESTS